MRYNPDNWVVIKIKGNDPHYRVLAGWSGGYTTGSSWKLNSGITKVKDNKDYLDFYGSSGSVYHCHKKAYGLKMNNVYIWNKLQELHGDEVELLDEDTDWFSIDWIIK
mgnify:CR=1 FL=1